MTRDEFSLEAIRRAPVAEGVLMALSVLFSEERIAALYEKHRGASYEGQITFHTLVEVMYSAVIEHEAVGSAAIRTARNAGKLNVSDQATYGKIRRVRQSLCNAIVCTSMEPLMEMFPAGQAADQIQSRKQSAAQVARRLSRLWDQDWIKARRKKRTTKAPPKKIRSPYLRLPPNAQIPRCKRCLER